MAKSKQPTTLLNIITDEQASAASVRPNAYNPNRQSDDEFLMLCKSIVEDGFTDAIIVNTDPVSYTHLTLPTNREV